MQDFFCVISLGWWCTAAPVAMAEVIPLDLISPTGKSMRYQVEIAANAFTRQKGLMHREDMAEDQGMLFLWPEDQAYRMWMQNTLIPLDIVFFQDRQVKHIETAMRPGDLTARGPNIPVDSALELNAGDVGAHGISVGWTVSYTLPAGVVVE